MNTQVFIGDEKGCVETTYEAKRADTRPTHVRYNPRGFAFFVKKLPRTPGR